jgi:hypothetical protein
MWMFQPTQLRSLRDQVVQAALAEVQAVVAVVGVVEVQVEVEQVVVGRKAINHVGD